MKSSLTVLMITICLADARLVSRDNATTYSPASLQANNTRYALLDNDWGSTAFLPYLLALGAGMKVLGLASDTANTWVDQTTLHGVSFSNISNRTWEIGAAYQIISWQSSKGEICPVFLW